MAASVGSGKIRPARMYKIGISFPCAMCIGCVRMLSLLLGSTLSVLALHARFGAGFGVLDPTNRSLTCGLDLGTTRGCTEVEYAYFCSGLEMSFHVSRTAGNRLLPRPPRFSHVSHATGEGFRIPREKVLEHLEWDGSHLELRGCLRACILSLFSERKDV